MNEHRAPPQPDVARLIQLLAEQAIEHAVMLLDLDGRIRWWNPGAERIFGIAVDDVVGRPLASLFSPGDVALGIPDNELAIARSGDAAEDDR